jgi:hypothetical protein
LRGIAQKQDPKGLDVQRLLLREQSREARPRHGGGDVLDGVGPAKPGVTVNRGTFDISIETPAGRGPSTAKGAQKQLNGIAATTFRPQAPPQTGDVESLLVAGHAAPPADQARVEGGAVVLSASVNANGGNGNSNGNGNRNGNGNGNGNGIGNGN